jgi:two-component system cell cycle response regulator CtrA
MRVLLLHGNQTVASGRAAALGAAGFVVDTVLDADEAFECFAAYEYDIVVLDRLPVGFDACKIIRRMRLHHIDTPVVVVTSWVANGLAVTALRAGADDVLTHPLTNEELVARIEAILRRRGGHAQSKLQVGSMAIDMNSHEVAVAGQLLRLSNKEFGVLQTLALRRGTVVTKEQVLNALYDGRDDPHSRVIEVFVCYLRKKLAEAGADVTIDTVHGIGYILRAGTARKHAPVPATALRPSAPPAARRELMADLAA